MLAVLVLLRTRRGALAVLACALVPAVLAIDLARHDYSQQNPHQPAANWDPVAETFPSPPATARFLLARQAADGPMRFAWLVNDFTRKKQLRFSRDADSRDLLLGMAGTRYGLEDVAGYDPVQLLAYHDAIAASNGRPPSDRHFLWIERAPTRLLRRLGVRYYVAAPEVRAARHAGRAAHAAAPSWCATTTRCRSRASTGPGAPMPRASSCAIPTAS